MDRLRFHLVNVFADSTLSGNALCVFEDGTGLTEEQMQGLALQFNLSETTFLLPSAVASVRVRIFTPSFELPFAGHPVLGSAHVVRALRATGDAVSLETGAGVIPMTASGDCWTLQARPPATRRCTASPSELAQTLGLDEGDLDRDALWVDTGSEQLVVPLRATELVDRCRPDPRLLALHASNGRREGLAYAWAWSGVDGVVARFFFLKKGSLLEDPGTGSACANLGGWLVATGHALPVALTVRQGDHTGRPCRLNLRVDSDRRIFVSGRVIAVGSGEMVLGGTRPARG